MTEKEPHQIRDEFNPSSYPWPKTLAEAIDRECKRILNAQAYCDHADYKGMETHGRCCPLCGTFMVDFGD